MKNKLRLLEEAINNRENNFDLLRLSAALIVLTSHSFALTGQNPQGRNFWVSIFGRHEPSSLAVGMFFVISGFLIAGSLERRTMLEYARARALRIIPALAVLSVLTVFIVGPFFTKFPLVQYFSTPETYSYLFNSFPYRTYFTLPGVFSANPYPGSVNGSLWTIPIEAFCYIAIAALYVAGRRGGLMIVAAVVCVSGALYWNSSSNRLNGIPLYGTTELLPTLKFGLLFLMGSMAWIYRAKIPLSSWIGIPSILLFWYAGGSKYSQLAMYILLPYIVIYLAYGRPLARSVISRFGDVSYGVYLYAFVVQQILVSLSGNRFNAWTLSASAAAVAILCGWVSWHYVEKPVMKLKGKMVLVPTLRSV